MAPAPARRIIASLFDRLTDSEPLQSREIPPPERDQRERFKANVARDLANLLNTRRSDADIPEEFSWARKSVMAYGMPDYSTAPMDREAIRRAIERVVRLFEPRLSRVDVAIEPDEDGDSAQTPKVLFRLAFRITGMLKTEVGPEGVAYDASLPKDSRRFQVVVGR